MTDEHAVIDDAIQDSGEGYTVFSIPVGVLYRPSESKLKNSKTKDYMGKAVGFLFKLSACISRLTPTKINIETRRSLRRK